MTHREAGQVSSLVRQRVLGRGFTLLEVLVAVSILGLGLTVVLSSQVGLFSSATHVEHLTYAVNLGRCRMEETSLELLTKGFSLLDEEDEGPCCEEEEDTRFRCSWKIQRVELPEPLEMGDTLGGDAGALADGLGPIGALAELGKSDGQVLGEKPDIGALAGYMNEAAGGGMSGIVPMLMSLVYPSLKPMLEASIRKVSVRVAWREGVRERDFQIVQYVTNPQQGGLDVLVADQGLGAPPPGGSDTNKTEDGP